MPVDIANVGYFDGEFALRAMSPTGLSVTISVVPGEGLRRLITRPPNNHWYCPAYGAEALLPSDLTCGCVTGWSIDEWRDLLRSATALVDIAEEITPEGLRDLEAMADAETGWVIGTSETEWPT